MLPSVHGRAKHLYGGKVADEQLLRVHGLLPAGAQLGYLSEGRGIEAQYPPELFRGLDLGSGGLAGMQAQGGAAQHHQAGQRNAHDTGKGLRVPG